MHATRELAMVGKAFLTGEGKGSPLREGGTRGEEKMVRKTPGLPEV